MENIDEMNKRVFKNIKNLCEKLCSYNWMKSLINTMESNGMASDPTIREDVWHGVYLVGGTVRDMLMDRNSNDIDIMISSTVLKNDECVSMWCIEDIQAILEPFGDAKIVGSHFSVIKFRPDNSDDVFDITIPRSEKSTGTGHRDFEINTQGVKPVDDLKRRDFTINAIAVDIGRTNECVDDFNGEFDEWFIKDGVIYLDPFKGFTDIRKSHIKSVSRYSFIEDPLRMLRALQFSIRLGFEIEESTKHLIMGGANLIKTISGERIRDEILKAWVISSSEQPVYSIKKLMDELNLSINLFGKKMSYKYQIIGQTKYEYDFWIRIFYHSFYFFKEYKSLFKINNDLFRRIELVFKYIGEIETLGCDKTAYYLANELGEPLPSQFFSERYNKCVDEMNNGRVWSRNHIKVDGNDVVGKVKNKKISDVLNHVTLKTYLGEITNDRDEQLNEIDNWVKDENMRLLNHWYS